MDKTTNTTKHSNTGSMLKLAALAATFLAETLRCTCAECATPYPDDEEAEIVATGLPSEDGNGWTGGDQDALERKLTPRNG